jgi:hypothetical protein
MGGINVAVLLPLLRQHELLVGFEHGEAPDLLEISGETGAYGGYGKDVSQLAETPAKIGSIQ